MRLIDGSGEDNGMTREEAIDILFGVIQANSEEENEALDMAIEALEQTRWIPCSERLPNPDDCPMDCMVTRRSKYVGYVDNYVDMAVAEADGTWTHEDWKAIVWGDVESGRKTGLISTRDDEVIAWMPLPEPWKGEEK